MKQPSRAFKIPFAGLKLGTHEYQFQVDKSFFEQQQNALISDGEVQIDLSLEKKETMMIAHFRISGVVNTICDRCADPIDVPVEGTFRLVYKFGDTVSDDESLIILSPETFELDIRDQVNELITVSLPTRVLHEEGTCNPEMMELYGKFVVNPEDDEEWDQDWDDEDWDADDSDDEDDWDEDDDDEPEVDPDKPIDPRWSALKNLN